MNKFVLNPVRQSLTQHNTNTIKLHTEKCKKFKFFVLFLADFYFYSFKKAELINCLTICLSVSLSLPSFVNNFPAMNYSYTEDILRYRYNVEKFLVYESIYIGHCTVS